MSATSQRFDSAAHPKNPRNGQFTEKPLTDPGDILASDQDTASWVSRGVPAEVAAWWASAGFTAAASDDWRRNWFTAPLAAAWRSAGFDAFTARDWSGRSFSPASAAAYVSAGFSAADAEEWRNSGMPQPPAPAGDLPPVGDGGPADLTVDQIDRDSKANPYSDVIIPPQEVPALRHTM